MNHMHGLLFTQCLKSWFRNRYHIMVCNIGVGCIKVIRWCTCIWLYASVAWWSQPTYWLQLEINLSSEHLYPSKYTLTFPLHQLDVLLEVLSKPTSSINSASDSMFNVLAYSLILYPKQCVLWHNEEFCLSR